MESRATYVDLLRHGSCEGGEIYRGSTDVCLDSDGWRQMQVAMGGNPTWDRVITSPLQRCSQFAADAARKLSVPLQVEVDLREMHFGDWEGQLVADVWAHSPVLCRAFYNDPLTITPPQAEPLIDVKTRALGVWKRLLEIHAGEHLLLVSHGGIMRALLSEILRIPLSEIARINVPYGALCKIAVYHTAEGIFPVLLSLNPPTVEA